MFHIENPHILMADLKLLEDPTLNEIRLLTFFSLQLMTLFHMHMTQR